MRCSSMASAAWGLSWGWDETTAEWGASGRMMRMGVQLWRVGGASVVNWGMRMVRMGLEVGVLFLFF